MTAKRLLLPGVSLAILALLAFDLINSPSGAAATPPAIDLVGTYQGTVELTRSDYIGKEPLSWHKYPPDISSVTMTLTNQEGSLFWGQIAARAGGSPMPIEGAMIPSGDSSATICITMPSGHGHGSATIVPALGGQPAQVTIDMLMTSGGRRYTGDTDVPGEYEHWSGRMVVTKQ